MVFAKRKRVISPHYFGIGKILDYVPRYVVRILPPPRLDFIYDTVMEAACIFNGERERKKKDLLIHDLFSKRLAYLKHDDPVRPHEVVQLTWSSY